MRMRSEAGQTFPLVGLVVAVIVGICILSVSLGNVVNTNARAQTAADAAALAGAAAGRQAAQAAAEANGAMLERWWSGADDVTVQVRLGDTHRQARAGHSEASNSDDQS